MKQIKCSKCGEWNNDLDYCQNCSEPISREVIEEIREDIRQQERGKEAPSFDEVIIMKARNSKNVIVKFGYYSLYTVSAIVALFGAFIAWGVAMVNA